VHARVFDSAGESVTQARGALQDVEVGLLSPPGEIGDAVGIRRETQRLTDAVRDGLNNQLLLGVAELRRHLIQGDEGVSDLMDAGAIAEQRPRTHWRLASVFAQDQIAELPPPAVVLPLDPPAMAKILGDSHAERLDDLRTLITDIGYQLKFIDTGAAEGRHYATGKLIEISNLLTGSRTTLL
jgi:hypothetical protein